MDEILYDCCSHCIDEDGDNCCEIINHHYIRCQECGQ
jgi:hypothetical protein